MKNLILKSLFFVFVLNGCATNGNLSKEEIAEQATFESREQMLISARNQERLVDFYKEALAKEESSENKIKLINAYIQSGNTELAAFHLGTIKVDDSNVAEVVFLRAKVYLEEGLIDKAYINCQTALSQRDKYPEAENLMGLILAEKGEFEKARNYFLLARGHYHDDLIISNNLAVLDLIQEDYDAAIKRLQPIYAAGNADRKIKSNLVFALTKKGQYKQVETILREQGYKEQQIQTIFIALREANSQLVRVPTSESLATDLDPAAKKRIKVVKGEAYDSEN
ncbi:hypothetical protein L3V77_13760 [Vibrio sp. DW001]|uniref:hypothetical protein n=1 Tax=Vibrio sp. DW001 TaxID=2912315 RepID=UPI0023B1E4C9|nr:hypothetical protein [Vibrio sp. DW001]WED26080.1 hypothetical protein L3V77_13760 [Vibrio sp. DW001]